MSQINLSETSNSFDSDAFMASTEDFGSTKEPIESQTDGPNTKKKSRQSSSSSDDDEKLTSNKKRSKLGNSSTQHEKKKQKTNKNKVSTATSSSTSSSDEVTFDGKKVNFSNLLYQTSICPRKNYKSFNDFPKGSLFEIRKLEK